MDRGPGRPPAHYRTDRLDRRGGTGQHEGDDIINADDNAAQQRHNDRIALEALIPLEAAIRRWDFDMEDGSNDRLTDALLKALAVINPERTLYRFGGTVRSGDIGKQADEHTTLLDREPGEAVQAGNRDRDLGDRDATGRPVGGA